MHGRVDRLAFGLGCCLLLFVGVAKADAVPRIVPSGIKGTLLLCGPGEAADAVRSRFLNLVDKNLGLLIIRPNEEEFGNDLSRLLELAKQAGVTTSVSDGRLPLLKAAAAVWLFDNQRLTDELRQGIVDLLGRGGLVAIQGTAAESLADVLSDFIIETKTPDRLVKALQDRPGHVGLQLANDAALLIRGRGMIALGSGEVIAHLAASRTRPAERIALHGRPYTDLTLLRRAARFRADATFPPETPHSPVVERGTLVIVGGGKEPAGLSKRFVELAGGKNANIVILPTAGEPKLPVQSGPAEIYRRLGATVTVLPGSTLAEVESPEYLDALRKATGIWFGGGRQWRFVDAYDDTKALPLMRAVLERGGVIGGTSAGASIQSDYMPRGSPYGNLDIIAEGYERGLGFLKGVAIDQHFSQRRRHADMTKLMKTYPQYLGIGIDEATALIVRGHNAEVVGAGKAFFYDYRRPLVEGQPDYEAVPAGMVFDLTARKLVKPR